LEPFLRSHKGKQLGQKIKGMFWGSKLGDRK
jgi:hypothetical protein